MASSTRTGEELDPKVRGSMLDEGVRLLDQMLRGEHVVHTGDALHGRRHHPAADRRAAASCAVLAGDPRRQPRPVRRAARYEGLCPTVITPIGSPSSSRSSHKERGSLDGFDFALMTTPDHPFEEYRATRRDVGGARDEAAPHRRRDHGRRQRPTLR